MHAFWNSARGKHFLGRNGDLDHGLIRQEVGILVLRERGVCILTLNGRGNLPPMNPPRRTTGSEQYFRHDGRGSRNRYSWWIERGPLDTCSW